MREKSISVKTYQVLLLIPLYYIIGNKNIFLYALTLCLYNIFVSCFTHVSIKDTLAKVNNKNERKKFFKIFGLVNVVIQLLILILSIIVGDITSAVLKIDDVFFPFLFMGLSVFTELLLNYLLDYLDAINYKKVSLTFFKMYYYIEGVLLIIISLLLFKCFKINNNLDIGLMYLSKIISISNITSSTNSTLPAEMIKAIEKCGFFESIPLWAVTLIGGLVVTVLSFIMIMTVYGRFFKLYLYTAIAPIPFSTFAGEPTQNVGKSFLKSYSAVCLEGAIIILSCIIFSLFASTPPVVDTNAAAVTQVWKYIGELVFNMLVLVGTIKMSDRVVREMMGL